VSVCHCRVLWFPSAHVLHICNLELVSRRWASRRLASVCLRLLLWFPYVTYAHYGIFSCHQEARRSFASVLS
jgi:hypothetical protein